MLPDTLSLSRSRLVKKHSDVFAQPAVRKAAARLDVSTTTVPTRGTEM